MNTSLYRSFRLLVSPPHLLRPLASMAQKRSLHGGANSFKGKRNKRLKASTTSEGSNEEVILHDVRSLLEELKLKDAPTEQDALGKVLPPTPSELEVTISRISSTGDGLGEKNGQVYVVPFTAPGDVVTARVYKHFQAESYSLTDFVKLVTPSQFREGEPPCQYFTQCSGCQFQHLPYAYQLAHKKSVVERAYKNFSNLPASVVPAVGDTIPSPLQYGYRTKLTPHFDGPPRWKQDRRHGAKVTWPEVPPIGFMKKGTRKTIDIEDCLIGTEVVRLGMKRERGRVKEELNNYQKGATLLLRESIERVPADSPDALETARKQADTVLEERGNHVHVKTCITNNKATSTEYVDDFRLDNPAGAFFQNNSSILPSVTRIMREELLQAQTITTNESNSEPVPKIKNMIDAYCGSGFFTITLSGMFQRSIGIDVSSESIEFARKNAERNNLPRDSTHFIAADANALFASVDTAKFPPAETVVIIDPPRKGCDENFVRQLLQYGPQSICYVSCNVHTQARDVGWMVGGLPGVDAGGSSSLYELESVRGADFFPQTYHVEAIAMLRKKTTMTAPAPAPPAVVSAEALSGEQAV
jgi:tRNA (uracil-5-)-methyltransferase